MRYVIEYADRAPGHWLSYFEGLIIRRQSWKRCSSARPSTRARRRDAHGVGGRQRRCYPASTTCERTWANPGNRVFRVPSWSGGSELAELFVHLDLRMDLSGPAFSLSVAVVTGGGMTSTSASNAEETKRAA